MVGRLVRNNVQQNALYKVCDVVENVRSLGVKVSYKKAWLGKNKAIEAVYGKWETSYNSLPSFLMALQSTNPGTVVEWRHTENSVGDCKVFHSVFWAFKPCIDGFKHCRPVITIDATFQYGKYKEKLLIAVGVDAGKHLFPLAFAIVDEENLLNWSWFLDNVQKHVIQDRVGICLISDRHRGIIRAVETEAKLQPPYVYHRFCIRHVQENFSKMFKSTVLNEMMDRAARTSQVRKFEKFMHSIRELNEDAYTWLNRIPLDKWTLCHDGGFRYGIMTTNNSESFNNVLKGARRLPITACVRMTFYRLVEYFDKHRAEALQHIEKGDPWPRAVYDKYLRYEQRSKHHYARAFHRPHGVYEVITGRHGDKGNNVHTVNVHTKSCTCGKFQLFKFPCSHIMTACGNMGRSPLGLVDGVYSSVKMVETYRPQFYPVPHEDYWPTPPFHLVANPARVNHRIGRPRSTRILNQQDHSRMKHCGACGQNGHRRRECPNREQLVLNASRHP